MQTLVNLEKTKPKLERLEFQNYINYLQRHITQNSYLISVDSKDDTYIF